LDGKLFGNARPRYGRRSVLIAKVAHNNSCGEAQKKRGEALVNPGEFISVFLS
jgi:hypothetical protein